MCMHMHVHVDLRLAYISSMEYSIMEDKWMRVANGVCNDLNADSHESMNRINEEASDL